MKTKSNMAKDTKLTLAACYFGIFTQATVANLPPLFYVLYNQRLMLPMELIAIFPFIFFAVQIAVDSSFSKVIEKIGYRFTAILADLFSISGLVLLGLTPLFSSAVVCVIISTVLCAIGSGIIEITGSPLIEALPGDGKTAAMSLLHSFYCWGHLFVVLFSTLFFNIFGEGRWYVLPLIFAIVPAVGIVLFCLIEKLQTLEDGGRSNKFSDFGKNALFPLLFLLMICAGAGEQAVGQWASFFAEQGLNVSKTTGDLLGTSAFALCMAAARTFFGIKGEKIDLKKALTVSAITLTAAYLLTSLSPLPALSLVGIGLCGLAVGIFWPGILSLAGQSGLGGGTLMFALLALGGDIGCTLGPSFAGEIAAATDVSIGILSGTVFPILAVILLVLYKRKTDENKRLKGV